jgi:hypothetical protein
MSEGGMTANELADFVEISKPDDKTHQAIATMLRQQAQEIAILKQIIDANNLQSDIGQLKKELALQRLSDIGQEIENEPVAHRFKWEEKMSWQYGDGYDATGAPNDPDYFAYEPLYTHPNEDRDSAIYATGYWKGVEYKRMRELTDEEIYDCFKIPKDKRNTAQSDYNIFGCREVADAILKKASEK